MEVPTVRVRYHQESEGWWAESPDIEGFVASGGSLHEVRQLTHEGLPFYLDTTDIEIIEEGAGNALVVDVVMTDKPWFVAQTSAAMVTKVNVVGTSAALGHVGQPRGAGVA
jgi:predicted RNase H-like HicB family nuclease